jgi:phosphoglycerol transferase
MEGNTNQWLPDRTMVQELKAHAAALGLCLLILTGSLRLWRADLGIPLAYSGDSLFTQLCIKGIIENGWYLHNNSVGAPGGSDLHDFPQVDNFHFLLLKALSLVRAETAFVFNAYYLLTFPLVTLASLLVLRHFRLADAPSIVTSLLYTFLPYHFRRCSAGHLFLAAYFLIPLVVMIALWTCAAADRFSRRRLLYSIVICLVVSSAGVYYAFFACFLLLLAGLLSFVRHRTGRPLGRALVLVGIVFLGTLANGSPTILYRLEHGANTEAVQRLIEGPEIYGLKITQMLLPTGFHRLSFLAAKKAEYNASIPVGSGDLWYLGVVGAVGFLALLVRLLAGGRSAAAAGVNEDNLDYLAGFNVFAVLLATVAGFGALFSFLVCPWIRCYERMSIYIAFFCLFAITILLERLASRFGPGRWGRVFYLGLLSTILVVGIGDQVSRFLVPFYSYLKEQYASDAQFVAQIESALPQNAMIFQLPYMPFPESFPVVGVADYDLLRGYLHSRTLRWSYGAMKGRAGDAWYKVAAKKPLEELMPLLAATGFHGIYLDRFGFLDNGAEVEDKLTKLTGLKPLVSANQRLVFFKLD